MSADLATNAGVVTVCLLLPAVLKEFIYSFFSWFLLIATLLRH